MRSSPVLYTFAAIGSLVTISLLLLAQGESQIQPKGLVVLQGTTPGTAQTGHLSVSGTGLFGTNVGIGLTNPGVRLDVNGQVRCTAFRLNSGGVLGKVLTSDASGIGTWQSLPVTTLTLPYSGTASSGTSPLFLITNTGDAPCIRGYSSAPTGTGVQGINSVNTGNGIGVYGEATSPVGHGVVGHGADPSRNSFGYLGSQYDAILTSDPTLAAGVVGESGDSGVYGRSATGNGPGVSGESSDWIAVGGWTNSGFGVRGMSFNSGTGVKGSSIDPSGVGVEAQGSGISSVSQGTALSISGGAIAVPGAGIGTSTPAFIHRATALSIFSNYTTIDHPLTNGDPNAILIITPNWNPGGTGGTYNNHAAGVFYTGTRWAIFNQDLVAMPVNAAFNVLVVKTQVTLQSEGPGSSRSMMKPNH